MKYNYRVAQRVYASTHANMAEQFKIYLNPLQPDKIDETENDFRGNGNGLLSVRQTERETELFVLLQCFTISTDIFLFPMVKLLLELLEKN